MKQVFHAGCNRDLANFLSLAQGSLEEVGKAIDEVSLVGQAEPVPGSLSLFNPPLTHVLNNTHAPPTPPPIRPLPSPTKACGYL